MGTHNCRGLGMGSKARSRIVTRGEGTWKVSTRSFPQKGQYTIGQLIKELCTTAFIHTGKLARIKSQLNIFGMNAAVGTNKTMSNFCAPTW